MNKPVPSKKERLGVDRAGEGDDGKGAGTV
jgi:hypothetical protein